MCPSLDVDAPIMKLSTNSIASVKLYDSFNACCVILNFTFDRNKLELFLLVSFLRFCTIVETLLNTFKEETVAGSNCRGN